MRLNGNSLLSSIFIYQRERYIWFWLKHRFLRGLTGHWMGKFNIEIIAKQCLCYFASYMDDKTHWKNVFLMPCSWNISATFSISQHLLFSAVSLPSVGTTIPAPNWTIQCVVGGGSVNSVYNDYSTAKGWYTIASLIYILLFSFSFIT